MYTVVRILAIKITITGLNGSSDLQQLLTAQSIVRNWIRTPHTQQTSEQFCSQNKCRLSRERLSAARANETDNFHCIACGMASWIHDARVPAVGAMAIANARKCCVAATGIGPWRTLIIILDVSHGNSSLCRLRVCEMRYNGFVYFRSNRIHTDIHGDPGHCFG